MAAKCCSTDIIKCLVEHGADVNAPEGKQGRTILHKACEDGNETLVIFLLNECGKKLDLDATTYAGFTAFQMASILAQNNPKYRKIVQELLKHGADSSIMNVDDSDSDGEDSIVVPSTVMPKLYENNCPVNVA